ncbi:hypothetical protein FQA47_019190 [Oryzias melastigma]|uniref:Uncharacterized protein n=1 Tax=Oryzias melastigma TaxID=30732 RepID=A0A834C498_ORYME|nr:hypothetical protein FQA47_019190 [Oryzias melastigma]
MSQLHAAASGPGCWFPASLHPSPAPFLPLPLPVPLRVPVTDRRVRRCKQQPVRFPLSSREPDDAETDRGLIVPPVHEQTDEDSTGRRERLEPERGLTQSRLAPRTYPPPPLPLLPKPLQPRRCGVGAGVKSSRVRLRLRKLSGT